MSCGKFIRVLHDRALTEPGQVRMQVNVFLEDENIRRRELLATQVREVCEITFLPSVSGRVWVQL
jgi:molybdopterin converting factor small subunit